MVREEDSSRPGALGVPELRQIRSVVWFSARRQGRFTTV